MKSFIWAFLVILSFTGCAGSFKKVNAIDAYQYGDDKKSCKELQNDLSACKTEYERLQTVRKHKIAGNVIMVGTSLIFWPALLFIDVSDKDVRNIEAQQTRYQMLSRICIDKNCKFEIPALTAADLHNDRRPYDTRALER